MLVFAFECMHRQGCDAGLFAGLLVMRVDQPWPFLAQVFDLFFLVPRAGSQHHSAARAGVRAMATSPGGAGGPVGPNPGRSELDADAPGGGGFALLAAAHATLAATAFLAPDAVVNAFFPGSALPQGMENQVREGSEVA